MLIKLLDVLLITILGSFGSYYFKLATLHSKTIIEVPKRIELYFGSILYLISIFFYIKALRITSLSILLPQTALTYVWTLIISYKVLKETMTKYKFFGAFLILLGSFIVSLSK